VGAPVPAGESGATLTLDLTDARVRPQDVIKSEETWLRQLGADTIAWEPIDTRTLKAHVYLTHPLARVIDWRELAPVQGVKDHAPMGVTAIPGQQATFWWRGSQLVTGASGSGKTMTLRSMLRGLVVQQVPVRVTLADNKGDFVDWSTSLGVDQYARDHGDCVDLVDHFGDRMDQRYADRESWPIEDYALTPRPWEPLEVLIVGEGLTLLGRGTQAQQRTATRRVKEVAQTGREAACVLWLVTQTSTKDESAALAAVRDFFPGRILHRVPNASMITPALGVGADAGAAAHRIPMALEGVGYYLDPLTGWPVMFRGAYLPRSEQAHLSAQLGLTYSQDLVRQHEYDRALRLGADPDRTAWSANRGGTP
jgi:hypothetical protein